MAFWGGRRAMLAAAWLAASLMVLGPGWYGGCACPTLATQLADEEPSPCRTCLEDEPSSGPPAARLFSASARSAPGRCAHLAGDTCPHTPGAVVASLRLVQTGRLRPLTPSAATAVLAATVGLTAAPGPLSLLSGHACPAAPRDLVVLLQHWTC